MGRRREFPAAFLGRHARHIRNHSQRFLGQRTSYLERVTGTGTPLDACERVDNAARWAYYNTSSNYRVPQKHNRSSGRDVRVID